jgi:hypothetical protein
MKEKDLEPFRAALTRYLYICKAKHLLNCVMPFEKMWDLGRHIFGLIRKHTRHLR